VRVHEEDPYDALTFDVRRTASSRQEHLDRSRQLHDAAIPQKGGDLLDGSHSRTRVRGPVRRTAARVSGQ
jgi:hypothetical protein